MRRGPSLVALTALALASPSHAHVGVWGDGFSSLVHPVGGWGHVLALLGIGLVSAQGGRRSIRMLVPAFLVSAVVGFILGSPATNLTAEILFTLGELGRSFEIIFVDDHSQDRTRDLISAFVGGHPELDTQVVLHETNRGRGATVSDGFRAARGRLTGYLDIDLEVHCRHADARDLVRFDGNRRGAGR